MRSPCRAGDRSRARARPRRHGRAEPLATIAAELAHCEASWPQTLPTGVIHADLFNDNVFFLHDQLSGLIDFYFACNDILAYDLAICLNAWCFSPDYEFDFAKGSAMIAALSGGSAAGDDEKAFLPLLARGSALRFLLTRLVDWLNVPPGRRRHAEGPARISEEAALPPEGRLADRIRPLMNSLVKPAPRRVEIFTDGACSEIPGPAAGGRNLRYGETVKN